MEVLCELLGLQLLEDEPELLASQLAMLLESTDTLHDIDTSGIEPASTFDPRWR